MHSVAVLPSPPLEPLPCLDPLLGPGEQCSVATPVRRGWESAK